jgi:hypothetical protein
LKFFDKRPTFDRLKLIRFKNLCLNQNWHCALGPAHGNGPPVAYTDWTPRFTPAPALPRRADRRPPPPNARPAGQPDPPPPSFSPRGALEPTPLLLPPSRGSARTPHPSPALPASASKGHRPMPPRLISFPLLRPTSEAPHGQNPPPRCFFDRPHCRSATPHREFGRTTDVVPSPR